MDEFDHCIGTVAVGACGIGKNLYLTENAVDKIMPTRRPKYSSDVVGYLVKVTGGLIAHYHCVALHKPHPVCGGKCFRIRPATYSLRECASSSAPLCECAKH